MDLTLPEIIEHIAALQAQFLIAKAANDRAQMAELEAAFQALRVLRARASAQEADTLAETLDNHTAVVERAIVRLTDPNVILTIRNLTGRVRNDLTPIPNAHRTPSDEMPSEPPVPGLDRPDPAPEGGPSAFVSARRIADRTVLYIDDQGRSFVRVGGSRSWRNCNPGNIKKGSFAVANGSIGDDGSFAIFPNRASGLRAIETLLRGPSYRDLTVAKGIERYAPRSENDTDAYIDFVTSRTGLKRNDVLGALPVADLRKLVKAIEMMEGWHAGEERRHAPSSGIVTASAGGVSAAVHAAAEWMDVARREEAAGVAQIPGPAANPRILEYFKVGAPWFNPLDGDETDWCAVFVNFCLETSGHVGTNHPGARSFFWNKERQFVKLPGPRKFAIAVQRSAPFSDPAWSTGKGHVGFVVGFSSTHVRLLGGNQSNRVREQDYPLEILGSDGKVRARFVAYMMPAMN